MVEFQPPYSFDSSRARFLKLLRAASRSRISHGAAQEPLNSRLKEVFGFGSNPGRLRMFTYRPDSLEQNPALVVVLHGCTQTAAGYDIGAGWSTLADRYGFALLLPEQQRSNNPNGCFNWFVPEHNRRDQGEPLSIRQMIEKLTFEYRVDPRRVFITGLSAGGAMTSIMLACYPEIFAAGAIIAGLPYGAATNVQQAFESMRQSSSRSPEEWGNLVRRASSHRGPWPRVSVWHGDADNTVVPSNALAVLKQWTDVHGLALAPSARARVDGYPREVWLGKAGEELVEAYTISDMAHGTPLAIDQREGACGSAGPFLLPVGISSSYHIAKFFGITHRSSAYQTSKPARSSDHTPEDLCVLEGEILRPNEASPSSSRGAKPRWADIGATINNAFRAAGLIKD
jgi:poly(hydroxyalkanoate) depolymerase family esterase